MSAQVGSGVWAVSLAYFNACGLIEGSHQLECRVHEYEVSIRDEEGGCARELALPEEVDFAVDSDEVLEEDDYWKGAAVSVVHCMWEMRPTTDPTLRG